MNSQIVAISNRFMQFIDRLVLLINRLVQFISRLMPLISRLHAWSKAWGFGNKNIIEIRNLVQEERMGHASLFL